MNEIVKDKMKRQIMVIKNDILFSNNKRKDGFLAREENYEKIILENYEYMIRKEAETNTFYKQPIPYGVLICDEDKIFVYKRGGSSSSAGESRLHSKISFGLGGHIEISQGKNQNIIKETLLKEIEEEIGLKQKDIKELEILGYINDDANDVGSAHFGVAYIVKSNNTKIILEDGELEKGEFLSIGEIEKMINSGNYDIENWSKIIYNEIKLYLKK